MISLLAVPRPGIAGGVKRARRADSRERARHRRRQAGGTAKRIMIGAADARLRAPA
jgi:hypothetical protein